MQNDWLADRFEAHRPHVRAVAYRMLGSSTEADDAVQEAWLRFSRTDTSDVDNLAGWLTTVVARVCLDMLRSRAARREEPSGLHAQAEARITTAADDPEDEAVLADAVGTALLIVLDTLEPAERLAFVLHDMFAVSFDEIAPIVGRSAAAARQLASRGRRRVQGADLSAEADRTRQRDVVQAFLAASRDGDFEALLALLHPDVVLTADAAAVQRGAHAEVRGPAAVAQTFSGRAQAARLALLDGRAGLVWAQGGRPQVAFEFAIVDDVVVGITLVADGDRLAAIDFVLVDV